MFAIAFEPTRRVTPRETLGRITIGRFSERFSSGIGFWKRKDYEAQWTEGVARLLQGYRRSALITDISRPPTANFFVWWPMWREGEVVFVQNHLFLMSRLRGPFHLANPYVHVGRRRTESSEGRISEWRTTIAELARFAAAPRVKSA